MTKVLIITYYWPPAGGAGVQRWVKLSKYLTRSGIQPVVLTVDERHASYMQYDESLLQDVDESIEVVKTKSFEPINLYAKLVGKKNVPTAGFSNVNNKSWTQRIVNFVRSNLFIPDPRKGWNKHALRAAIDIIRKENITTVITSTPPHSSQLIGLQLKRALNVNWIADLRDPWTDIYYFNDIGHSWFSRNISKKMETKVLLHADRVITVSDSLVNLFGSKDKLISKNKFKVIPNGYDPDDFIGLDKKQSPFYNIVYTGSMSSHYVPGALFQAIKDISSKKPQLSLKLTFVGEIDQQIMALVKKLGIQCEFVSTVPHSLITQYQKNADLLLLVIPDVVEADGILTGKLFEYLASENPIIGLGPNHGDAAQIIRRCNSGEMFNRSQGKEMAEYLHALTDKYERKEVLPIDKESIEMYSRKKQAENIHQLIMDLS